MGLLESCKTFLTYSLLLFWPNAENEILQKPLIPSIENGLLPPVEFSPPSDISIPVHKPTQTLKNQQGLVFQAPQGPESGEPFYCQYPNLDPSQWTNCDPSTENGCWLKGPNNQTWDINTTYEDTWPTGIIREVCDGLSPSKVMLNLLVHAHSGKRANICS
jgi:hypothetical protein